ncbi:MAG: alanine--tRNA ligase [Oscillospiraceae bacterium]|nr:alanine--tRNA ligase [Oscillospiraceae bacterium]
MKKYGLNELREMFLSFFEEKGHLRLPSFPLIPQNDPSLLLINSGMAPMKRWFTNEETPPKVRVCTCQRCIRTDDIENVDRTARHISYFEMLGNFSFGDYFKRKAIAWCWEFLTERLEMDPNLLYPSVYIEDDEAFDIWSNEIGMPPDRITRLGKADNFWDHGQGPCGPCSEVYYDRGEEKSCGSPECGPGCDCDRYVEIWNNVFTQYNNDGNNHYTELSQKNIDTGMGLERLAMVYQGVENLFEVDTIMSIVHEVSRISGVAYGKAVKSDVSIRVITDHIRAVVMMISDGVRPSNEGRGYVLRRLLRRAARHGKLLGIEGLFLHELCEMVIAENAGAYPELLENRDYIARTIRAEEESFGKTIDSGSAMLMGLVEEYKARSETTLSGKDAFRLYDTYGFPLDMTVEILSEQGLGVDAESFNGLMQAQRTRARKARVEQSGSAWGGDEIGGEATEFTGFGKLTGTAQVTAIADGVILLDKTPFYAEQGGQSADFGTITNGNAEFAVDNVELRAGGKYLHHGKIIRGSFAVGDSVTAAVDQVRRAAISRAHSATHLLHAALRAALGGHVEQAGSLVEPDRLRFDFTHFSALTGAELEEIEHRVNSAILDGNPITSAEMPIDEAKKQGAMALFGEKYGDTVRVVKIDDVSAELCGGTHLDNTAKVGAFAITAEFSVASGVRRIEATTGRETLNDLHSARAQLTQLSGMLKAGSADELPVKVEQNIAELRELRNKLNALAAKESVGEAERLLQIAKDIGGLKVITAITDNPDNLRQMADSLRDKEPNVVAVLAAVRDGKITITAACGKPAIDKGVKAGDIIREVTKVCGGSGGGKPDFAMGGGKDPDKLKSALDAVGDLVKEKL